MPEGQELSPFRPGDVVLSSQRCDNCQKVSDEIFTAGWTCLQELCENFFTFPPEVDINSLEYADAFLNFRVGYDFEKGETIPDMMPPLPVKEANTYGTEKIYRIGIVCPGAMDPRGVDTGSAGLMRPRAAVSRTELRWTLSL